VTSATRTAVFRWLGPAVLALALPAAAAPAPPADSSKPAYRVLVFTKAAAERHASTKDGVAAIRELGKNNSFTVEATDETDKFVPQQLARYRAVVFLNTSGNVLTGTQQAAFEDYFRAGGGFVGIHSAIETEPDWQFFTDILGTRSTDASSVTPATIKVADRVHEASAPLPEYWNRTDQWYNFAADVRGFSHVLATVDEKSYSGGTMGFDHPIAWCKDYKGGRSFYTGGGHTASTFAESGFRAHLAGAIRWAAGVTDPVYSDCGATVLANYEMSFVAAPPNISEPIGFDVLPDGRVVQTDRRGGVRLHDPRANTTTLLAQVPVYTNSEDGMYGPAVDKDFATNKWAYLYYAPPTVTVTQSDGVTRTVTTPPGNAPNTAPDLSAWDPWLGYFQLSRFKFVDATDTAPRTSTWRPSSRSSASRTTAARAATSPATSRSTRPATSGSSPATTRLPAAEAPAVSRPSTT
jgi:cytochrome c